jgi:dipeptidyl aminopeptidase/acylaminoacyl peptidase
LEYFTKNVVLPMPNGGKLTPATTPWILVGGSYSGALTSYTLVAKPGLFAAGYASSAVVETILDFWQYFEPERLFMPANCSADIERVISHIDQVSPSF